MSDQNSQQEPSMEEILASIRRIISEDVDEEGSAAEKAVEAFEAEPKIGDETIADDLVAEESEYEEEVLELIDEVQDDGTVVNLKTGETLDEDTQQTEEDDPHRETGLVDEITTSASAAVIDERLVSQTAGIDSVSSLSALAAAVDDHRRAYDPSIGPRTIEDLVKEVMRPMIREWLDDNLPALVERLVGREIERLTREAEDISQR